MIRKNKNKLFKDMVKIKEERKNKTGTKEIKNIENEIENNNEKIVEKGETEIQKIISFLGKYFSKTNNTFLSFEELVEISDYLGIDKFTLKKIYSNHKYKKDIEEAIKRAGELRKSKKDKIKEYKNQIEKDEKMGTINLRTGQIDINVTNKLSQILDILLEEKNELTKLKAMKNGILQKFLKSVLSNEKKIKKKVSHIISSLG